MEINTDVVSIVRYLFVLDQKVTIAQGFVIYLEMCGNGSLILIFQLMRGSPKTGLLQEVVEKKCSEAGALREIIESFLHLHVANLINSD